MKKFRNENQPQAERESARADKRLAGGGTLFVVATPIGNLEDITPRAIRVLSEADGILCEDTRVTLKLLNAVGVDRPLSGVLERADEHATEGRLDRWIDRLRLGESLALVSDAGTPAISDPGAELVARCGEEGIRVVVVPGASALTAFLSGAGFVNASPVFRGFFPRRPADRENEWKRMLALPFASTGIWFESPERIEETLAFLAEKAPDRRAVFAKELTKRYERFHHGSLSEIASHIRSEASDEEKRGEWVFGIAFDEATPDLDEGEAAGWRKGLRSLLNSGVSASQAAREISQVFGISKKIVYSEAVILAKSSGSALNADDGADE